ncbi:solute carrier family 23 protein [uncultured Tissierella sp.]|uniref:uracil-xanthine permease family protein n=1 Tax=uncultured Tissierella sp. TaxID=448160 RepID=UPI0028053A5C|nr:solute carrier family 23 protein [uncultured Tissierella sp.]MDU5081145.1 solute carrier family 23 protein [Bacillota bacterium]
MRDRSNTSKFHLDGILPLREAFPLGLQHVIAMFVPNLVPMMLVSQAAGLDHFHTTLLIQCAMIGAAIGTLLQEYPISLGKEYRIGSKLPVMLGLTYVFMPTCIAVAGQHGMATIFGAQIVAGLISIIFGVVFKKVRKYFPPVVTGTVVLSLGLSVFSLAINNIAGGASSATYGSYQNWIVGMTVVVIVLFLQQWGKGLLKDSAILVGMLAGYIVAFGFNMIDFSPIAEAAWFAFPKPLAFGLGVVNAKESIAMFPETFKLLFGQSSVVLATTIAVILNLIFPKEKEDAIEVRDKSSKKSIEVLS